jgi:hypothetical protein
VEAPTRRRLFLSTAAESHHASPASLDLKTTVEHSTRPSSSSPVRRPPDGYGCWHGPMEQGHRSRVPRCGAGPPVLTGPPAPATRPRWLRSMALRAQVPEMRPPAAPAAEWYGDQTSLRQAAPTAAQFKLTPFKALLRSCCVAKLNCAASATQLTAPLSLLIWNRGGPMKGHLLFVLALGFSGVASAGDFDSANPECATGVAPDVYAKCGGCQEVC